MHASTTPRIGAFDGPRLLFTDLDGSLLDHHDYDWKPAEPWLDALRQAGVAVIPVTSKTRSELGSACASSLASPITPSSPRMAR